MDFSAGRYTCSSLASSFPITTALAGEREGCLLVTGDVARWLSEDDPEGSSSMLEERERDDKEEERR